MSDPPGEYVDYCGIGTAAGPLDCGDTTLRVLFVRARRDALAATLERVFERTTGGEVRCRPLVGALMMTFGVIRHGVARTPKYKAMGYIVERNVVIYVPTVLEAPQLGETFAMWPAALWIDNPIAIAGGRESYGYNKQGGTLRLPENLDDPAQVGVDAYAWNWGPDTPPEDRTPALQDGFIVARPEAAEAPAEAERELAIAEVAAEAGRAILDHEPQAQRLDWIKAIMRKVLVEGAMPQVFLRQFHSPAGGLEADVQQVVVADAKPSRIRIKRLPRHILAVKWFNSHPLRDELGLAEEQPTVFAMRAHLDFTVESGAVLWSLAARAGSA